MSRPYTVSFTPGNAILAKPSFTRNASMSAPVTATNMAKTAAMGVSPRYNAYESSKHREEAGGGNPGFSLTPR